MVMIVPMLGLTQGWGICPQAFPAGRLLGFSMTGLRPPGGRCYFVYCAAAVRRHCFAITLRGNICDAACIPRTREANGGARQLREFALILHDKAYPESCVWAWLTD